MNTLTANIDIDALSADMNAWLKNRNVYIELTDGRINSFLSERFLILKKANEEQLTKVDIRLNGFAL